MTLEQSVKNIGMLAGAVAILATLSYCSERPKYHFEKVAAEVGKEIPGARLIDSFQSGDLASPVSWIWSATTTWVYAVPDPLMKNRFLIATLVYGEKDLMPLLEDIDCTSGKSTLYSGENVDETMPPARDIWGDPVKAANGKTFREFTSNIEPTKKRLNAFCHTDWTTERAAVLASQ